MIRMAAADLRVMGRATQGVRLINLKSGESIASVAKVPATEVLIDLELEDLTGPELGPELGPEAGSEAVE